MSETPKFKGFLSYSRKDEDAVRRLHRRLESFEIPRALRRGGPARLGRFFRDKDELAAASALGATLNDKIAAAEWLIVCCSPAAVASQWVNTEVDAFIGVRGHERVLAVVLDGEPHEVFPPALREREPLAADFRKTGDGEELGFLKLVAGLLDADLGELRDRQAAAERARTRNRAILASVFAVLAVAAGASAVIAVQQRDRAEAMTMEAIDIGAGVLGQADNLSQRFGVPTSALSDLLGFAEQRFDRLYARNVQSQELARQRATVLVQFAELYQRTGDSVRSREQAAAALAIFNRFPQGTLRTIDYVRALAAFSLADEALGRDAEALDYANRAVAASRQMLANIPDGRLARIWLAGSLERLGELHMRGGRPAAALPLFTETVPLLQYVHDQTPNDGTSVTNLVTAIDWLGSAQALLGDRASAQTSFARASGLARDWLRRDPENLAARETLGNALMKMGQTFADSGDPAAARPPLEESLAIARTLVASDPNDAGFRSDLSLRLVLTAQVLSQLGQAPAPLMEEAIGMARAQVRSDPANVEAKDTLARMLAVRASQLQSAGNAAGARDAWREIAQLRRAIRTAAPGAAHAAGLAFALETIGDMSANLRDLQTMLAAYSEAVSVRRAVLAGAPGDRGAQAALADALHALGQTKSLADDGDGARAAFAEAARLRLALANAATNDAEAAFRAVDTLQQLGVAQVSADAAASQHSFEQARGILRRLVAAHPDDARFADSLRRTEEALAAFAN